MSNHQSLETAFNTMFEAESDAIFRFCLFRVSDREQALDLVQDTFARAWRAMQDGTVMDNARAFLFTVAHRLVIDWYRKKKPVSLEAQGEQDGTDEIIEPADPLTQGAGLELAAEGRFLISKLGELDHSYRQAVYLRYVEGLSPPEIGKILGMSEGAASVRINRGIKQLREIAGYGAEIGQDQGHE